MVWNDRSFSARSKKSKLMSDVGKQTMAVEWRIGILFRISQMCARDGTRIGRVAIQSRSGGMNMRMGLMRGDSRLGQYWGVDELTRAAASPTYYVPS